MTFAGYRSDGFYDEMFLDDGTPRPEARPLLELIEEMQAGERALLRMGITFAVYGDDIGTERIFPFDIIPRIVTGTEWNVLDRGLHQRIRALNHINRLIRPDELQALPVTRPCKSMTYSSGTALVLAGGALLAVIRCDGPRMLRDSGCRCATHTGPVDCRHDKHI